MGSKENRSIGQLTGSVLFDIKKIQEVAEHGGDETDFYKRISKLKQKLAKIAPTSYWTMPSSPDSFFNYNYVDAIGLLVQHALQIVDIAGGFYPHRLEPKKAAKMILDGLDADKPGLAILAELLKLIKPFISYDYLYIEQKEQMKYQQQGWELVENTAYGFSILRKHSEIHADDEIDWLIEDFKNKDVRVSRKAIDAVVKLGKAVVNKLIKTLKDDNRRVRECSAVALTELGDVRAIDPLIEALNDNEMSVRRYVAQSFLFLPLPQAAKAVNPLIHALKEDEDYGVRYEAARSLGRLGGEKAIKALKQALQDDSKYVREAAKKALEKSGKL